MYKQYHFKAKKGAASLFVVIFTIILLGVITLGFSRIMLSDASRTSDNDLSQSAYDAALAGVEDAKAALIKYHKCFKEGGNNSAECNQIKKIMSEGMNNGSCDVVADALSRERGTEKGETPIRQSVSNKGNSDYMDQAYTCVTIKEKLSDYRSQLNSDSIPTRLVPLKTNDGIVAKIIFKWHSSENRASNSGANSNNMDEKFYPKSSDTANQPPVIGLQFVQTDNEFTPAELSASKANNQTDRSTIYLKPATKNALQNPTISAGEMSASADKSKASANEPHLVKCDLSSTSDYACSATISLPHTFNNQTSKNSFFIVSTPYGEQVDFSVQMQDDKNQTLSFEGAQARIDSTGRANELYRRVEARVDLTDVNFPYPEYAIQMSGSGNQGKIEKNLSVTRNCWHATGGKAQTCQDVTSGN